MNISHLIERLRDKQKEFLDASYESNYSGYFFKYFSNLNLAAIKGDDSPNFHHDSRVRESSEVVIKFTQIGYISWLINHDNLH